MTDDDRHDDLAARIVAAMDRLARGQRTHRQAIASRYGLTPLQLDVLTTVQAAPPPDPLVGRLATELGVAQPTVTDSLQALERKGLIARRHDPTDRRRTLVELTPAGADLLDELAGTDLQLVAGVAELPRHQQEAALELLLTLIGRQLDAGVIDVARTCLTCRFHRRDRAGTHRCTLLAVDLPRADLRLNCPEHEPAATAPPA